METSLYLSNSIITALPVDDFRVDGDLYKPVWVRARRTAFETSYDPGVTYPEARTEVAALWSAKFVYFAFWNRYEELNLFELTDPEREKWELWNRDVVEVFINTFPDRVRVYWEFEVAPNNLWIDLQIDLDREPFHDAGWDSGFDHKTAIEAESWHCEMRIPVSCFGVSGIEAGMEWRANFYRCDGPGDDTVRRFLAWSPTYEANFHVPTRFGILRFEEATAD